MACRIWSCNWRVCAEMKTLWPVVSAHTMDGYRYALVLPVPVGASISVNWSSVNACQINAAISVCEGRSS